ncbi:hypothetical protein POPTR_014G014000v4 [Populus trichocarpa]|uniref:Phytosulfokine n=1 Tax=Populus trichocarpa TaxID=3694 RepID=B9IBP4_POPTR|nr:phytosulfokines 3 [Populus trichocarpa]KAI5563713.1 hypothetical protein BDE02_14G009100 [Populus trichocarpa]PNT02447.1 hypothetical protein POPTR_014G014000v4 [Populus trichocarpa]|eukprot:XP_002320021.1 phytosulfokines 3 [Populus trichocarpa]
MSKLTALFTVALLLSFTLTYAARPRPVPVLSDEPLDVKADEAAVVESCEGLGVEACLARRTLAAQVDYIYTQKQNP